MSLKKVIDAIKNNKSFLITTHTSMEGDALGSELGFYRLIRSLGKNGLVINDDKITDEYNFLPGINSVKKYSDKLKSIDYDCFVTLDCSDLARCGGVGLLKKPGKTLINIDHHISNAEFGDINWVDAQASSASEMVYKLYKDMRVSFNKDIATLLYVGMFTDTGSFRYSNTTGFTHRASAELLEYGLDVQQLYRNIYENIPCLDMKLLSKIASTIDCNAQGRIAWVKVKSSLLKKAGTGFDLSEHLLTFCRAIKGVDVAVLFKENLGIKNEIRVNFRSQGRVDVNKIAAFFGGGGHKTASGCTIKGNLNKVANEVLAKIKKSL